MREVELDSMEGEQTWPTDEELAEASRVNSPPPRPSEARKVPRGTSDYQAAWIVADSEEEEVRLLLSLCGKRKTYSIPLLSLPWHTG